MALEIAPEKVAHVIIKAREYDAKVGAWNDTPEEGDAEEDPSAILEDFANDPTRGRARRLHRGAQRRRAGKPRGARVDRARHVRDRGVRRGGRDGPRRAHQRDRELSLGIPLLADYLEEGLEKMGYSVEDVESDVL